MDISKIALISLLFCTGCSEIMPGLFKTVDDIATDTAIKVEVDRDAMQKNTNVDIAVKVINDASVPPPVTK
jgi:coenzyme F420-reducing hydrogenase gamma subunit